MQDVDHDKAVTFDELCNVLRKKIGILVLEQKLKKLFEEIDSDLSGGIGYRELCTAIVDAENQVAKRVKLSHRTAMPSVNLGSLSPRSPKSPSSPKNRASNIRSPRASMNVKSWDAKDYFSPVLKRAGSFLFHGKRFSKLHSKFGFA